MTRDDWMQTCTECGNRLPPGEQWLVLFQIGPEPLRILAWLCCITCLESAVRMHIRNQPKEKPQ